MARSGELAPTHSSSADVSQSIVTTFSLRSRYDMWGNHDMMTISAYDSEHDPLQEVLFISICILEKYFKKIQEIKEGK